MTTKRTTKAKVTLSKSSQMKSGKRKYCGGGKLFCKGGKMKIRKLV